MPYGRQHIEQYPNVTNNYDFNTPSSVLTESLQWPDLNDRRMKSKATILFKAITNEVVIPTHYLSTPPRTRHTRSSNMSFTIPHTSVNSHLHSFYPSAIRIWNNLPDTVKKTAQHWNLSNRHCQNPCFKIIPSFHLVLRSP